ncbi:hypothetical protein JCM10212_006736 [Sporobolomyces blumeae]
MECIACTRSDQHRHFYCPNCLRTRLAEYHQRKQQLRNALTLQSNRASALLNHPPSAASATLAVRHESQLKADRWSLSVRLRDARLAVDLEKARVQQLTAENDAKRAALASRRANLSTARSLLTSLSSPPPHASTLPSSISSLTTSLEALASSVDALETNLERVRKILTRELLTVYAVGTIDPPLPDPFLPSPSPFSSTFPPAPVHNPTFSPTYTLTSLPLPALSLLPTLAVQTLEPLLAHLAHFVRLLALYERVTLPYAPVMNAFGNGRPGVKASPGWGVTATVASSAPSEVHTRISIELDGSGVGDLDKSGNGGPIVDMWPLCFGLGSAEPPVAPEGPDADPDDSTTPRSASKDRAYLGGLSSKRKGGGASVSAAEKQRMRNVLTGAVALAFDLAFVCWTRDERRLAWCTQKALLRRGRGESEVELETDEQPRRREWKVENLEDLGKLVKRAAGAISDADRGSSAAPSRPVDSRPPAQVNEEEDLDPFPPTLLEDTPPSSSIATLRPRTGVSEPSIESSSTSPAAHAFPLSFPTAVEHFLSLALDAPTSSSRKNRSRKSAAKSKNGTTRDGRNIGRGTRMGESSFVDAGATRESLELEEEEEGDEEFEEEAEDEEADEEEEEEEEWDFV